jgi:hypothetical protein
MRKTITRFLAAFGLLSMGVMASSPSVAAAPARGVKKICPDGSTVPYKKACPDGSFNRHPVYLSLRIRRLGCVPCRPVRYGDGYDYRHVCNEQRLGDGRQ